MGGPELAAAAAMLNASITCFLISAKGLDERCFAPPTPTELRLGAVAAAADAEGGEAGGNLGVARGEGHFCLVTAGRFFWSTRRREWVGRDGQAPSKQAEESKQAEGSEKEEGDAGAAPADRARGKGGSQGEDRVPRDAVVREGTRATQEAPPAQMEPCAAKLESAAVNARQWGLGGGGEQEQEEEEEEEGRVQTGVYNASAADETGGTALAAGDIAREEESIAKMVGGDVASWPGYGEEAAPERTGRARKFVSRYSPLFLKCIVDVEAKFAADGLLATSALASCVVGPGPCADAAAFCWWRACVLAWVQSHLSARLSHADLVPWQARARSRASRALSASVTSPSASASLVPML